MAERKIPSSLDAEKAVLGSAFLSKAALQKICDELTDEAFYSEANVKIFQTLKELNNESSAIDVTIVANRLDDKKILNEVGNIEYLSDIIDSVPSASNVDYYINIIKEKMIGRKVWWRSEPAIITSWIGNGQACVILEPDGIDNFTKPAEFVDDDCMDDGERDIKTDIFDEHIWWFRD